MAVENNIQPPSKKRSFVWNALLFVFIIFVVAAIWFAWSRLLSPAAQTAQEVEQNYAAYQEWEEQYRQAIAQDTYGGSTPEETLQLFIEALENGDVELASKYFLIDPNNSHIEYRKALVDKKESKELGLLVTLLQKMEKIEDSAIPDDVKIFGIRNDKGLLDYSITFKLNQAAVIWKIEEI
ncbi:hypothetical protein A2755_03630 [Candidatus Wolfebacteria bacterium RIFCSPHIGHO2_01_FULL_48_22]|uniref:DUF4878 domain-containing protein n=2 Tax=Candidatus Wolfeibacteriota TaxID=1752735 RepID=A0A1F8DQC5_9BACT|nr:MAG: hypothetical protein A2755_03630 [Candidatus Wolfebacteria bacterium RIFCSPHIGHO2_01_FULL_48_22]OGM92117.1 MAG: hypothetical protein A2935_02120 [Candidatus Wolfebacteria bacterium RIFCSPLOWO2_01_FULL_47_17b]